MPSILVRGLDQRTVLRLKQRARLAGHSLQQEVKEILERVADMLTMSEAHRLSAKWSHRLAGRSFSDSAPLIREDRDSR
jgi:plasmid stability protein